MPHFYCHLHGPDGCERDAVGLEFDGLDAVYLDVCRAILDIAGELARSGRDPMPYAFEIVDVAGTCLMDVPFREMLSRGKQPGRPEPALSSVLLRSDLERATDLRAEIAGAIASLTLTMQVSRALVARSRISGAADPWSRAPATYLP